MKKLVLLFSAIGMIALQSCEGPAGPPGLPGVNIEAKVIQVTESFNQGNEFSQLITFNTPMLASDVVLVYILWDVDGNTPIWRLMPQTVQLIEGDFIYNFDFTRFDVRLFLTSADFPLNILGPQWTNNQTFRIVLVPGYFGSNLRINYNDYDAVMAMLGLTEADVKTIESRN